MEEWLKTKGIKVISKPRQGISIKIPADQKRALIKMLNQEIVNKPFHTPRERGWLILLLLFTQKKSTTNKEIQVKLGVSRATILHDLIKIDDWLKSHKLELVKRQNHGCFIRGSEKLIRQAILSLLKESVGETNLWVIVSDLDDNQMSRYKEKVNQLFLEYISQLELSYFNTLTEQIQTGLHSLFTDQARMILTLQMAIAINRLKSGQSADILFSEINLLQPKPDYSFVGSLAASMRRFFRIPIPDVEVAYLTILVMEAKYKRSITNTAIIQNIYRNHDERISIMVDMLLERAFLYLHPALRLDLDLKNNLFSHLANFAKAQHPQFDRMDPVLENVKRIYPEAYKVTRDSVMEINIKFGSVIDEDEIGYLTMHFLVSLEHLRVLFRNKKKVIIICNTGVATSKLLTSRVGTEFPDIEIKEVMSYFEYKSNFELLEHDFVITSIPIPFRDKPAIIVDPLLDDGAVIRIQSLLNEIDHRNLDEKGKALMLVNQLAISDLLTKDTIGLQKTASNWQEVIDLAGNLLVKSLAVEPKYIQAMKSIRERYGPYMVIMPGMALLHAFPEDGVKRLCMSMITLNPPVEFGNLEFDPVSIAFALGTVDNHSHLRVLSELIDMMKNKQIMSDLRTTAVKAKALNLIAHFSGK